MQVPIWGVTGPSCEDIQILPPGYRITAKLLPLYLPQFPHLYKGDKDSSYLLVPPHLKALTFGSLNLKALSCTHSGCTQFSHGIQESLFQCQPSEGHQPRAALLQHCKTSKFKRCLDIIASHRAPKVNHEFLWSHQICHPLCRQGPPLSSQPYQTSA